MIQPAKVNFNRAMFVVVLIFGALSTLVLVSDPLNPENEEIPFAGKKTNDDAFATVETTLARSTRSTGLPGQASPPRAPASDSAHSQATAGFVQQGASQSTLQNPFGVTNSSDGIDVDCANPPSPETPKQTQAARIRIQLNNCQPEGLKLSNKTNGFEATLLPIGPNALVTDLISLVDKENEIEVTSPNVNFKFKIFNSLPHR